VQSVLDPGVEPISGDPDRLQQVVGNLLLNAVKFTPKGGRVQLHLQRADGSVQIVVSDTGQGIAPEVLPVIFERFRQADSSSTRMHAGLGLGLALVKHLVELHGGQVAAQSPGEGKGATFVVTLPAATPGLLAAPIIRARPATSAPESTPPARQLAGVRVVLVDDDPDAVELAATILRGAGANVHTCRSAAEALDAVQAWRPDVLVSDIEMPGEDGYALIRRVRTLPAGEGGTTPAIALTAYGRTQDRALSLAAGYSMHVPKPVDPGELTAIVASLAGRPTTPTPS
jgi:CheY-like chemotaxis protein